MAAILLSSVRAPRVYALAQIPAVTDVTLNTIDPTKLGSQIILDNVISIRMTNILEPGSDAVDFTIPNTDGRYSPINTSSTFGRYFFPGAVDNKYQIYVGLTDRFKEVIYPRGTFVSEVTKQESRQGQNILTLSCLDQFSLFRGQVYTQVPPRLYGNQQSVQYNPNYNLVASPYTTFAYQCDAINWMQTAGNTELASDYVPVAVYSSNYSGGTTPVPNSGATAYTIDYVNGTVTFVNDPGPGAVISVDARPQAISAENALKHLFNDFGAFSSAFMKFDNSGVMLPVLEIARDRPIMDIATDIISNVNARGVNWQLFFDENGYLNFGEAPIDGPPVRTLIDEHDIISITPEYTARDIKNVIRATAQTNNNQPVVAIAYDVLSISIFGQKPTFDIPPQFLSTVRSLDIGTAMSYLNGLVSSVLFQNSTPVIQTEIQIVPDPTLQVGDPITVIEKKTGINKNFYIKQITTDINGSDYKQTLRLEQLRGTQDLQFGLGANIGAPLAGNPNAITTQSGLIAQVSLNGTTVVNNGQPVLDTSLNPVIYNWNGGALNISITLASVAGANSYVWRWMYVAEDALVGGPDGRQIICTGSTAQTGIPSPVWTPYYTTKDVLIANSWSMFPHLPAPYDVLNNVDSPRSRRYYWPLLRPSDWLSNDGVTAYSGVTTLNSTWTGGPADNNGSGSQLYGNLRVGINDYFQNITSGFVGAQLYTTGTVAATTLAATSTIRYGCDFGTRTAVPLGYAIKRKVTPAYLGILVATTAGTMQFKRICFQLSI